MQTNNQNGNEMLAAAISAGNAKAIYNAISTVWNRNGSAKEWSEDAQTIFFCIEKFSKTFAADIARKATHFNLSDKQRWVLAFEFIKIKDAVIEQFCEWEENEDQLLEELSKEYLY